MNINISERILSVAEEKGLNKKVLADRLGIQKERCVGKSIRVLCVRTFFISGRLRRISIETKNLRPDAHSHVRQMICIRRNKDGEKESCTGPW